MTHNHGMEIEQMLEERREMVTAMEEQAPVPIHKHSVKNIGKMGGCMEWMPHVDKLLIEMLANRAQPSTIQGVILAFAKIIHPTYQVVKEMPLLRYIRSARTILLWVAKALAAMRIGRAKQ